MYCQSLYCSAVSTFFIRAESDPGCSGRYILMQEGLQATLILFFFHHLSFSCLTYKNTQLRLRHIR